MENYQIKGLRLNVKDNNVEFNVDEVNIPQDVCLEQLQLLGTIVEKIHECFMEMKPAITSTIVSNIANGKRMQDREDRRLKLEEDIKAKDIKIQELTERMRALVDEDIKIQKLTERVCALMEKNNSSK